MGFASHQVLNRSPECLGDADGLKSVRETLVVYPTLEHAERNTATASEPLLGCFVCFYQFFYVLPEKIRVVAHKVIIGIKTK